MNFNTSNVINNTAGGAGGGGGAGDLKFDGSIKDTIMYYQTTLRNVGLYTSISVALFTFSRFFADTQYNSTKLAGILIRPLSIFILAISCYMCYNLYNDVSNLKQYTNLHNTNNSKLIDINNWHNLLLFVLFILIALLFILIYIFYIDISYNRFKITTLTNKPKISRKMKEFSLVSKGT